MQHTVGAQIDAAIAQLSNVSSTQIFAVVIAVSLCFSFILLNSGGSSALTMMDEKEGPADSLRKPQVPNKKEQPASNPSDALPEPRWHILKLTNFVAVTGFLLSVLQFAFNASTYLNDSTSLLQFLGVWSIFLMYFFGFFGISFIELDDFVPPQPQQPVQSSVSQVAPRKVHKAER